jgi:tetratricopeptide (TPR) repeat protein
MVHYIQHTRAAMPTILFLVMVPLLVIPVEALSVAEDGLVSEGLTVLPALPPEANPYLEYLLGHQAELVGRWEDALEHYSRALKIDEGSPHVATQIGHMLIRLGRIQEALSRLEEITHAHPAYVPALLLLGQL